VQWMHRVLGTILGLAAIGFSVMVLRTETDAASRRLNLLLLGLMLVQYLLGVLTLLYFVPVTLGVIHQAMAMVLFGVWVWWLHHVLRLEVRADADVSGPAADPWPPVEGRPASA
jgi:heme a synthase